MTSQRTRERLLTRLMEQGISNMEVLDVIRSTPRHIFLDEALSHRAYEDVALPIGFNQTISQPYVVAFMTEKLEVEEHHKVLEIGTGSGYQAAVLSKLCSHVYTIERYRELQKVADAHFEELGIDNISTIIGDGWIGWPPQAPFDRIIVTAAAPEVPEALVDQLKVGGRMIIPIGENRDSQSLIQVDKFGEDDEFTERSLLPVRFVPLVKGRVKRS